MRDPSNHKREVPGRGWRNALLFSAILWTVLGLACSAMAQQAGANAGSQSGSISGAQINQWIAVPGGGGGAADGRQIIEYQGGTTLQGGTSDRYRATIRNTPDAFGPNVSGGTNPCLVGASGGGSVAGFGLSLGGNWSDPACERRNLAALLHNMGQPEMGLEVLCNTDEVRQARMRMGVPCIADRPQAPAVAQANAYAAPVAGPVMVPVTASAPPPAFRTGGTEAARIPDWCYTASPAERRRHPVCAGVR